MAEPAVVFDGVWKKFRRGERHDSLRDLVPARGEAAVAGVATRRRARRSRSSGRSATCRSRSATARRSASSAPTAPASRRLLKLLTRILRPTGAAVEVRGRVGALIEVAAGFPSGSDRAARTSSCRARSWG